MKDLIVKKFQTTDAPAWDAYVYAHPQATLYHLSGWQNIINKTYGHKTCYLMAVENTVNRSQKSEVRSQTTEIRGQRIENREKKLTTCNHQLETANPSNPIVGILPMVHLKNFIFGNNLVSIPYFDMGGILADNEKIEQALFLEAIRLGRELKVNTIELRHRKPLKWFDSDCFQKTIHNSQFTIQNLALQTRLHKVRMLLDLPNSSETLMKSFKSKLRSQINKPVKEGLKTKIGGLELLDDFYTVFSVNMRDLGSPVHSKVLIENVLKEFPAKAGIAVAYNGSQAVASSVIIGFKDTLENPWSSALRKYSYLSPNMLLYWSMLEYACDNGFNYFDFGRSSPGEGSYKFKQQWGAKPAQLYWHGISFNKLRKTEEKSEKSKFEKAVQCWKKLPVPVTKIIGPMIRKYIGL